MGVAAPKTPSLKFLEITTAEYYYLIRSKMYSKNTIVSVKLKRNSSNCQNLAKRGVTNWKFLGNQQTSHT